MAGALALASTAGAARIKVTNTSGFGPGSLRSAIKSANHLPGFDQIVIRAIEVRRDDLIDVGDGRFAACTSMVGEGADDAPYTRSFAVVHRLRDSLIVEADYYLDREQALEAVGRTE